MLLNDFFFIEHENIGHDNADFMLRLNAEHSIFQGHFPMYPIAPGVCVTQIVIDLFSHLQQKEYELKKAKSIKFLNIIKPQETPRLNYQLTWECIEDKQYKVKALASWEDKTYAKFEMELGAAGTDNICPQE